MSRQRQRGSQAVEFALVLPFMILVIFAVLDFFFIVYDKAVITNASREAVRRGIILSASAWDPSAIKQVACNYARGMLVSAGAKNTASDCSGANDPVVTVSPGASSPPAFNTPVTVTVSYTVRGFSLGTWWNLGTGPSSVGSPFTLTATTQMNHE